MQNKVRKLCTNILVLKPPIDLSFTYFAGQNLDNSHKIYRVYISVLLVVGYLILFLL